jgi:hypothetical protein
LSYDVSKLLIVTAVNRREIKSMSRVRSIRLLTLAIVVCGAIAPGFPQRPQSTSNFVIDTNREFVYLKFDHLGKGIKRWDSEPEMRFWLRFANNCNVPIILRTYAVPEGSPWDEIGVMDQVVEDPPPLMQVVTDEDEPAPKAWTSLDPADLPAHPPPVAKPQVDPKPATPPHDYWFEIGSQLTVQPGKEVLFSIPTNQLGKKWHVEIPFEFEVPPGKMPRDPNIGGLPEIHLSYSIYDLPDQARAEFERNVKK